MKESITALEKKLRRKQNENINLMDNIEKLTKVELDRVSEIYELKEALEERAKECLKLSDELAVKTKEQIDNIKVRDLECEIEDLRAALKVTTEDLWLHKEKLKVQTENSSKRGSKDRLECENISPLREKGELEKMKNAENIIENQREEIDQLNDIISRGDEIIKTKDNEILNLKKMIVKDQEKLVMTEGEYSSLRCMMTEENETIYQVQQEMSRLLQIISADQEAMVLKDKTIQELGLEKDSLNMKVSNLKSSLDEKNARLEEAEGNVKKQSELLEMIESYKVKVKEAMDVIALKSQELEACRDKGNGQDSKELESLREEMKRKDDTIQQNDIKIKQLEDDNKSVSQKLQSFECEMASRDEEVRQLTLQVENEKKVAHHVQFTQERELMMKEKEIVTLSKILTQERRVLLEKEEEIKQLNRKQVEVSLWKTIDRLRELFTFQRMREVRKCEVPTRPPRTRSLFITTEMQVDITRSYENIQETLSRWRPGLSTGTGSTRRMELTMPVTRSRSMMLSTTKKLLTLRVTKRMYSLTI